MTTRWAVMRDIPEILEFNPDWTRPFILEQFSDRSVVTLVAEDDEFNVVGCCFYRLHSTGVEITVLDANVFEVCVELLNRVVDACQCFRRRYKVSVMVPHDDLASQLFFSDMGFTAFESLENDYLFENFVSDIPAEMLG